MAMSMEGISSLNSTPTSIILDSSNESTGLEDIEHLLYLEALKRFKDEETNIRRQIEDKAHQYEEAKAEYSYFYKTYVNLNKLAATRMALEESTLPDEKLEQAKTDMGIVSERVSSNKTAAYFDLSVLNQCCQQLYAATNHDEVQQIQAKLVNQKASVKAIQRLTESVQHKLEAATIQSIDYFVAATETLQSQSSINDNRNGQLSSEEETITYVNNSS